MPHIHLTSTEYVRGACGIYMYHSFQCAGIRQTGKKELKRIYFYMYKYFVCIPDCINCRPTSHVSRSTSLTNYRMSLQVLQL